MNPTKPKLRFCIRGPFRVLDDDGRDLTPAGRKAQAVLALLSTSETLGRTRIWLQDKLWSDRGPEQGSGSLRQCLSEIRRCLGDHRAVLGASRNTVWLERDRVDIDMTENGIDPGAELFEGLDIRDPEFDLWLVSLRAHSQVSRTVGPTSRVTPGRTSRGAERLRQIVMNLQSDGSGEIGFLEEIVAEAVSRNLREQADFDIHTRVPAATHPDALVLEVQGFSPAGAGYAVRAALQTVADGRVLWSDIHSVPVLPTFETTPAEILSFSSIISNRIMNAFLLDRVTNGFDPDANVLALLAMQKVFLLRAEEAEKAEGMLTAAFENTQRGVYKAWLAQLNTIAFVEGFKPRSEMADAAEEAVAAALALEGENSQVLTVAANCAMVFDRDPQMAGHLARMAVRANPANAMAWWVLGHIQLYDGRYEDSYRTSARGRALAQGTFLQYWLDFQMSFAASFCGKLDEARILGQAASVMRPEFRAAHRFSLALNAASGDVDRAAIALRKLRKLEAGFAPSRFVEDADYPVSLIRATPFYEPRALMDLEANF